jgi:hypothetical protein
MLLGRLPFAERDAERIAVEPRGCLDVAHAERHEDEAGVAHRGILLQHGQVSSAA